MHRIITKTVNTNVLVVDDNDVNLLIAKNTLESYEISVSVASGGAMALEMLSDPFDLPDLIILDCIMPEMSGHETAERIRGLGINTAIVAYTANDPDAVLKEFADVNVTDVLIKPLNTIELTRVLLKYLPEYKLPEKEETLKALAALDGDIIRETTEETLLSGLLGSVPGLDYMTGLHYSADNEESYLAVIRAAIGGIKSSAAGVAAFSEKMDAGLSLTAEESKQFRLLVHSMKGVCASIGLDALSKASAELEKAVTEAEGASSAPVSDYAAELFSVGAALSDAVAKYDLSGSGTPAKKIEMSEEAFTALVKTTLQQVKLFDIDAAREGLETLAAACSDPEKSGYIGKAMDAAGCFDYKGISRNLEFLL